MNSFDPFVENCSNYCIVTPSLWPSNVANSRLKVILAPKGGDEILKRDTVGKQIPRALAQQGDWPAETCHLLTRSFFPSSNCEDIKHGARYCSRLWIESNVCEALLVLWATNNYSAVVGAAVKSHNFFNAGENMHGRNREREGNLKLECG
jgi:hypothetical protein